MFVVFCCILVVLCNENYVAAECPKIISKNDWGGVKPKSVEYLDSPVDLIIVQHSLTQTCSDDATCREVLRELQKVHMEELSLSDIGPSFLISSNGMVYEGRGWNHVAVHSCGYNNQALGVALIGTFDLEENPPRETEKALLNLIKCGLEEERLSPNHRAHLHKLLRSPISYRVQWPGFNKTVQTRYEEEMVTCWT